MPFRKRSLRKIDLMRRLLWLLIPSTLMIAYLAMPERESIVLVALVFAWLGAALHLLPTLGKPSALLRRWPALLWLLILFGLGAAFVGWIVVFQPALGLAISSTEWIYGAASMFALLALPTAGRHSNAQKPAQLGVWAGPLVTLTTVLLIIASLELGLRYVWIMSDTFSFSAMHRTWQRVYWNPINAQGLRDYPLPPDDDPRTNILVLGDSFASGHGTNHIDDTFPHQLDTLLGDDYTVNILAEPGWGITMARLNLEEFPLEPDLLVLSHFVNDIGEGPAGDDYRQSFPQIRFEPAPEQQWWVENFFIANFLYYRATIFESTDRYYDWVTNAYRDPDVWSIYQDELQAIIDTAVDYEAPLVVLVWPNLTDVEGTRNLTEPVAAFFAERGVPAINLSDYLADANTAQLIANPFDAHPSIYSHRIAAEQLAEVIRQLPE